MALNQADTRFAGSIPQLYDRYLVPLIFEPYALDACERLRGHAGTSLLEIAAGTGAVTREMARQLPASVNIVATDLNQAMIDHAKSVGTARPVEWKQANAMELPFADASFDTVVCQFGMMFMPDKAAAFAQVKRVLKPGGLFVFNVWDRIEDNDFISTLCAELDGMFPDNPPRFMHRGPHGYFDRNRIAADLEQGGFAQHELVTVTHRSRAPSGLEPATGYCQGSPMRPEIEAHGPGALEKATQAGRAALERVYGKGPIEGKIQAVVGTARK